MYVRSKNRKVVVLSMLSSAAASGRWGKMMSFGSTVYEEARFVSLLLFSFLSCFLSVCVCEHTL